MPAGVYTRTEYHNSINRSTHLGIRLPYTKRSVEYGMAISERNKRLGIHPPPYHGPANSGSFKKGHATWIKGKKCPQATIDALVKSHKGKPAWNKGLGNKTPEYKRIRNSIEWDHWREAVFARDAWICQVCLQRGGRLHPHHIRNFAEFPDLRFAIGNGIAIHESCHMLFHATHGFKHNTQAQLIQFINSHGKINKGGR